MFDDPQLAGHEDYGKPHLCILCNLVHNESTDMSSSIYTIFSMDSTTEATADNCIQNEADYLTMY